MNRQELIKQLESLIVEYDLAKIESWATSVHIEYCDELDSVEMDVIQGLMSLTMGEEFELAPKELQNELIRFSQRV